MAPNPRTSSFIALIKPLVPVMCSLCSILGALRTGFYMMNIINTKGFRGSVCDNSFYSAPVSKFWAYAFVLSKAPELGESFSFSKSSSKYPHSFDHVKCNNGGSQDKTIKLLDKVLLQSLAYTWIYDTISLTTYPCRPLKRPDLLNDVLDCWKYS